MFYQVHYQEDSDIIDIHSSRMYVKASMDRFNEFTWVQGSSRNILRDLYMSNFVHVSAARLAGLFSPDAVVPQSTLQKLTFQHIAKI